MDSLPLILGRRAALTGSGSPASSAFVTLATHDNSRLVTVHQNVTLQRICLLANGLDMEAKFFQIPGHLPPCHGQLALDLLNLLLDRRHIDLGAQTYPRSGGC